MAFDKKYERLKSYLRQLDSVVVAFSGSKESTLLLKICKDVLGDNVIAIIANMPHIHKLEIDEAIRICKELDVEYKIIEITLVDDLKYNPENRCYLCKFQMFKLVKEEANKLKIKYVIDGTNSSDIKNYKPGMKALKELNINSPFVEFGINGQDVIKYLKELKINILRKNKYTCLLLSVPYNIQVNESKLRRIEKAQMYISNLGISKAKITCINDEIKIKLGYDDIKKVFKNNLMDTICNEIKGYGFTYVTLDLKGYDGGTSSQTIINK
jgi:uncharacterized protein